MQRLVGIWNELSDKVDESDTIIAIKRNLDSYLDNL